MSLATGMPQPPAPGPPWFTAVYSSAGTRTPPVAATTGTATSRRSRSCPTLSCWLISSPTVKKNSVISPSLTQFRRLSEKPRPPSRTARSVSQNAS